MIIPSSLITQDKYALTSDKLDTQEKELNSQIKEINTKMAKIISQYDLLKVKDIRILPYQTSYILTANTITIEKHSFIKDTLYNATVVGIKTKSIKFFITGKTVTKTESKIYEKNFESEDTTTVMIVDSSPGDGNTDSIIFNHTTRGYSLLKDKKMSTIKNTTAFPVRNNLKRDFIIPHLSTFLESLTFITESYFKSKKDTDSGLADFLRKSTKY